MRKLNFSMILVCIFIFVVSCSDRQKSERVILNDTLQLQQAQINSFDPVDAYHEAHIHMVKQLYNTLTDVDFTGKAIPSLAKSWETTDGIKWIFHLRDDVLFAENSCFKNESERSLNAEDVKYTFERLLKKESKSLGASYFHNIMGFDEFINGKSNNLEGLTIEGKNKIFFKLKKADFNFPNLLTLQYTGIVKRKAIEFYGEKYKLNPVGTGPFRLVSFASNQSVQFAKNPSYWEKQDGKQLPSIDDLTIHLSTDDNLSILMFKNKKIDFLWLNLPMQKQIENIKIPFEYKKEIIEWANLNFYLFNLEKLDNNSRLGINYAMNRKGLQDILEEQGNVTQSLYPSLFKQLSKPNKKLSYNTEIATRYLNAKRTIKLVCFEDILSRGLADYVAKSLKKYAITVEIESVTFPVLVDRLTTGKYDMIQLYWGIAYADVRHFLNPFITSSFPPTGNNFNKYSNVDFDALVEMAPQLPPEKQIDQYLNAQEIILNDMPFLLVYYKNIVRVSNNNFHLPLHPLGYRLYKFARKN